LTDPTAPTAPSAAPVLALASAEVAPPAAPIVLPEGDPTGSADAIALGSSLPEPAPRPEPPAPAAAMTWPEDWRQMMAAETTGNDPRKFAKALRRLERYANPPAVWAKAAELEAKLSQGGGTVRIPGPQAAPAERAAFHRALGVPETPEGYFDRLTLAKGRVLGDYDRPVLDYFAARLHPEGATPKQMSALADAWFDYQQGVFESLEEADDEFRRASEEELRRAWGGAYAANTRAIGAMLDDAPPEVRDYFDGGRTAEGRRPGDDPAMLRWLARLALALYPAGQHYGDTGGATPADRLAEIRKLRREEPAKYEADRKLQAEELELIEQSMGSGGGAGAGRGRR
jgi:hypothetical protein